MITVAWAPPDLGMRGITDASATHRFWMPFTLQYWSTTAMESPSGPILQVPDTCLAVPTVWRIQRSKTSLLARMVIRRVDPLIGHLLECVGLQQFRCHSHAFAPRDEYHFDAGDNSNERTAGHWDRPRPTVHILSRPATPACTRSVPPALGEHYQ